MVGRVIMGIASALLLLTSLSAQNVIEKKNEELQRLRSSIEETRGKIRKLSDQERLTRRSLKVTQKQRSAIRQQILRLEATLRGLQDSARVIEVRVAQTQGSIRRSEDRWRRLTRSVFEHDLRQHGATQNSRLATLVYQRATGSVTSFRNRMTMLADSLQQEGERYGIMASQQQSALAVNQTQRKQMDVAIRTGERNLQKVVQSKEKLVDDLRKKQASARRIAGMIQQLVRKEEQRQREQRRQQQRGKPPVTGGDVTERDDVSKPVPQRGVFARKTLPWPVTSRSIAQGYGMYRNPETGTTLENPGIDIRATPGSGVTAVAAGTVSTVTWLPGYGSLVIVDHQNGFRTVYANLSSVSVGTGSTVRPGSRIGNSGSNMDGHLVHFEIWNGSARLNPLTYLR